MGANFAMVLAVSLLFVLRSAEEFSSHLLFLSYGNSGSRDKISISSSFPLEPDTHITFTSFLCISEIPSQRRRPF